MKISLSLSYNDILLVPQKLEFTSRQEIDLTTSIAPNLHLLIPLISMGMDTVTGVEMAIGMHENGGISFYPRFDGPEIEAEKIAQIKKKRAKIIASVGLRDDYLRRAELCLKVGADAVACGSIFAGTEEAPGKLVKRGDCFYKQYNASTSLVEKKRQLKKNNGDQKPHFTLQVEGVESLVPCKGPLKKFLAELLAGIRSGFSYSGAKNIKELHKKAKFIQITNAGYQESLPHDVILIH